MANIKILHKSPIYSCDLCEYITANKKDYNKHILTRKHTRLMNANEFTLKNPYTCECGRVYKHMSSLCKHKRECTYNATCNIHNQADIDDKYELLSNTILMLVNLRKTNSPRWRIFFS